MANNDTAPIPLTDHSSMEDSTENTKQKAAPMELRLPVIGKIHNKTRNHLVAFVGEFCGTFLFLFMAFAGAQIANMSASFDDAPAGKPNVSVLMYISLCFGFSLTVSVWAFFRISGGLFNPAVAFALTLVGAINPTRAVVAFFAEILGAIASAGVVAALFPGPLVVTTDLNATTSIARGVFIEMFLTAELVFVILILAVEKHKGTFMAPIGIGLALFITQLAGVYFTGASLNFARSLGPAVINHTFPGYFWIYLIGPGLGGGLAAGLYKLLRYLHWETANPGADFDDRETRAFMFDERNAYTAADAARPAFGPPCGDCSDESPRNRSDGSTLV